MFFKDIRRADRRWRSRCKFIRRLKTDWNDHGWKRDPIYRRELVNGEVVACEVIGDTLCGCFDLTSKQALRFKDTPTGNHSKRTCGCNDPMTEYKDAVKLPVEREEWHKRKRREGTRILKTLCSRCGFLLWRGPVKFGDDRARYYGSRLCEGCSKAMEKKTEYWRGRVRVEFEKKPA